MSDAPSARGERVEFRALIDRQLRGRMPVRLPNGVHAERDGPLVRILGAGGEGFVDYRDLGGIEAAALDRLIARQVRVFAARGEPFEWKLYAHDRPTDLPERLRAAGLVPGNEETVLVAPTAIVARQPGLPEGVCLREVSDRGALERIEAMEDAIWNDGRGGLADRLEAERAADPARLAIVVAEVGDVVVCAGWVRFVGRSDFATLWGGGTLPCWRGRGIYRAVVSHRAMLAATNGFRYLQVDASEQSRPILERLGFVPVTTTTPFVWSPAGRVGGT